MAQPRADKGERVEYAPSCWAGVSPGVVSLTLSEDEDVRWFWTHYPDGRSVVTGYEIVRKGQAGGEGGFQLREGGRGDAVAQR